MFKKDIDFNKAFKYMLIGFAVFYLIGIIFTCIFGVNLDLSFKGGTRIIYSFTGEAPADADKVIEEALGVDVSTSISTSYTDNEQRLVISLAGTDALSNEKQQKLEDTLTTKYKDNNLSLYDSNSTDPTLAGTFFVKSIAAVLLAGILVVAYVGIRFRKIGGVSAALTAFAALFLDVFSAFFACVIFGLSLDSNFIAVLLTIFGYSLNDTIVIYDRVRENKSLFPKLDTPALVNMSVNQVKTRTTVTTITTFLAVVAIIVVAEIFALTTLRSFCIPMAVGLVSGCVSSLFVSSPLWVLWKTRKAK